jgi:ribonuclease T
VSDGGLWIMIDIETSGPVIGRHSMTELGAAVGSLSGGVVDRFEALVAPISDEVVTSRESFETARASGLAPADAMGRFAAWSLPYLERKARFVARPAAFDWPWIVWYAWTFLGENPFGFKAVCASSWFQALGRTFQVDLPHVAVEDAEIQLRHFLAYLRAER